MTPPERDLLSDVAASVSDAKYVDWAEAERSAEDDQQREWLRNFRVIADIAEIHRSIPQRSEEETAPAPEKTAIEMPRQWGHLEVLELLGQGAYAEVYRAHDTKLDRDVALKLYYHREKEDITAILKEGRLLAKLRHPNIVTVYGADEHSGRVGLWMELVKGQNLSQQVRYNDPFSAREAAGIGLDLCRAVSAIHKAGLLHRDIKAQNVMREAGGRILLLDLGFGSPQTREEAPKRETTAVGTPVYMAPELFRGEPSSVQTDIYSVGILLYFLTTGSFPYTDRDAVSARTGPDKTLRDERPELPDDFITVVDKAFAKQSQQRYASAGEMAAELGKTIGGESKSRLLSMSLLSAASALLIATIIALWPADIGREPTPPGTHSVVILPLNNRSEDPAFDFLSAGIVHGITSRLSQLEQLRVVSGTSAKRYQGENVNTSLIGRELSVSSLLNGHIDIIDDQIVVYVELVDTMENRSLWGQRFVRERGEILDMEEAFATQIAGALGLELSSGQAEQLAKRYTSDPEAYDLCQRASFFAGKRSKPDLQKALDYYQQAIDIDHDYAKAYAGLADTYALLGTGYFLSDETLARDQALDRAREAAQTAILLDDKIPEAHLALALLDTIDSNWPEAEAGLQRTIEISPNFAAARQRYSRFLSFNGRDEEAIVQARRAYELDPFSSLQNRNLGWVLYDARNFETAIRYFRDALELDPDVPATRDMIARCYWYTGEGAKAAAEYEGIVPWKARYFHLIDSGRNEEAITVLEQNLSTIPRWDHPLYYMLAGEEVTALNQLEELVAEGEPNTDTPLREKAFDHLVNDARFLRLIEIMKIGRHDVESMD
jgi:serine/threonine protein kinase/tetratricopeptide (TPR) repeat protein